MKFYTLVLFNTENLKEFDLEDHVRNQMEPFKLVEDDDQPYNHDWKWDYYCLYEKEYMAKLGFNDCDFSFMQPESNYVVCPTDKLQLEHIVFAVLTPEKQWFNAPYPLQEQDPDWDKKALEHVVKSGAKYGVYVYCHS